MMRSALTAAMLITFTIGSSTAADWLAFRGPFQSGLAGESKAPVHWSPTRNVRWKVALAQPSNGSPIVVGDRVLVASTNDVPGRQRSLLCFAFESGELLWQRTVELDQDMPTHKTNPHGSSTPASDGKHVVVWHASAGLHCYDLNGAPKWSRDLGEFRHMWGSGSSPILHQGRVILHSGPGERVFVTAIDLVDGKTLWETDEPLAGGPDRNEAGKYMGSWSTPVITKVDDREQIVVMLPTRVNAYDPDSGKTLWTCDGLNHDRGDLAYSSPVIANDICFVTGGFHGPSLAIRLGGSGNITQTHRLWRNEKNPQNIGSGVFVEGHIYRANAGPATIECIEPANGKTLWTERGSDNHWASIVSAGGLLYATGQKGTTLVFKPNPERLEIVAENALDETCNSTPAIADGHIIIRTHQHLYCIGSEFEERS